MSLSLDFSADDFVSPETTGENQESFKDYINKIKYKIQILIFRT